jgi:hypothetical protein
VNCPEVCACGSKQTATTGQNDRNRALWPVDSLKSSSTGA